MGRARRVQAFTVAVVSALVAIPAAAAAVTVHGGSRGSAKPALATVVVESPGVGVEPAAKTAFAAVARSRALRAGDTARTDATGQARIDYADGSLTRLDVNTQYELVRLSDAKGVRKTRGLQSAGRTWHRVRALAGDEEYKVRAANASASVLGTAFVTTCASRDVCTFTAVIDAIGVTVKGGPTRPDTVVTLTPGDEVQVTPLGAGPVTTLTQEQLLAIPWVRENLLADEQAGRSRGISELGSQADPPPTTPAGPPGAGVATAAGTGAVALGAPAAAPPPPPPALTSGDAAVPDAPTAATATGASRRATVTWVAPAFDGGEPVTAFVVTAHPGGATCITAATTCTVTGLTNGIAYAFTVSAANALGLGPPSDPSNPVVPAPAFLLSWGGPGPGDGQFSGPYGMATAPSGNLYVADLTNDRIQEFDGSGTFLGAWGTPGTGDGQFSSPASVAVDASGDVYVTDYGNDRVEKFDAAGTFLLAWGGTGTGDGQLSGPIGIAVGPAGTVYVAENGNDRVQEFDGSGTFLHTWGSYGGAHGEFAGPRGLAVDPSGHVFVADAGNDRVQEFDGSGTFLRAWGTHGAGNGELLFPYSVATDASGNVYVTDDAHRVQYFDAAGGYLLSWGMAGTGPGQFSYPGGVAVDSAGNVYVSDYDTDTIQKFG